LNILQAMRVFRRVVELEGFTPAARDLDLSTAAVSKQIAALEEHLRGKLLSRTTRRMSLTPAGAAYYERCVRILEEVEESERAVSRARTDAFGTLRVNAPLSFGLLHVSPRIPEFLAAWPDVRLELALTDRFVDFVREGVDVMLRIAATLPDSATLTAQKLARTRAVVCASPAYLKDRGEPGIPADLAAHDCIVYTGGSAPRDWRFVGRRGPAQVTVRERYAADNSLAIVDAAVAGVGLAMVPLFYCHQHLRDGRLVEVLRAWDSAPIFVHALRLRTKLQPTNVRVFVEFLSRHFAKAPWSVDS
jgi:DNA-binding transcriptional LysR family regulator